MPHDQTESGPKQKGGSASVRPAGRKDRAAITRMLGAAFQDEPTMCFIFPDAEDRRRRMPRVFAILYDGAAANGECYVTPGGEAATLWRAPGAAQIGFIEKLRQGWPWLRAAGFSLPRAVTVDDAINAHQPDVPHWYLHIAGCAPARQGQGFGSAAVRAGLARADADGVPASLETATIENVRFYEGLGFAVTHTWEVPRGPKMWSMLRPVAHPSGG